METGSVRRNAVRDLGDARGPDNTMARVTQRGHDAIAPGESSDLRPDGNDASDGGITRIHGESAAGVRGVDENRPLGTRADERPLIEYQHLSGTRTKREEAFE